MRLFDLYRKEDESGVSGTGLVAQGVVFDDGSCVLRWKTKRKSTAFYSTLEELEAIHGHGGKTEVVFRANTPFDHGRDNCVLDSMENAPFGSAGGLEKRTAMVAPDYIQEHHRKEYIRGYQQAAFEMYGEDWQTCGFGWTPALTIP